MPGINTSMGTSASMKSLLKTERKCSQQWKISSGKRINNAGDDAAGAAIGDECLQQLEHSICQLETLLMFYQWRKLPKDIR